ncbi:MAG: hypothetical protein HUU37_11540, partial [Bdellovibrionales bacterium]|nr:hypothetical protein [Bdellovibrionales bacterium]
MRRGELASRLQAEYAPGVECGVARTREKGYENIWFVVPPPPPCRQPARLPADALIRANRTLASQKTLDAADDLDLLVSHLFRSREAVQSSRMEGTWSTIDDVLTPGELFDDRAGPSERASVLGYADALRKEMASVAGVKAF